jgi:uncharacterized protein YecT (DUF1311 family)
MRALLFAVPLLFAAASAWAQYNGPAVEACRTYAKRDLAQDGQRARDVVLERDQHLSIERYTKNIGTQRVRSVLTGNGAIVLEGAPSIELGFICLLVEEKRPVFFSWVARPNATALAQCTREPAQRDKPRACLEYLLNVVEQDLAQVYANGFQQARERDFETKGESFTLAYRKSNAEWLQYREAECGRRRGLAPKGIGAHEYELACVVDLTRRRALDMR